MKFTHFLGAVAIACAPGLASAATLSLVGGDTGNSIPSDFGPLEDAAGPVADPVDLSAPLTIYDADDPGDGSEGLFVSDIGSDIEVTFTYIGHESVNTNYSSSVSAPGESFSTDTALNGESFSFILAAGSDILVPLTFASDGAITTPCVIFNGDTDGSTCQIAFSDIFNGGTSVYAMLGDGIGDSDLDDIVIRIDVAPVPLPGAAFLLLGGLGGLAAMKRRKKA